MNGEYEIYESEGKWDLGAEKSTSTAVCMKDRTTPIPNVETKGGENVYTYKRTYKCHKWCGKRIGLNEVGPSWWNGSRESPHFQAGQVPTRPVVCQLIYVRFELLYKLLVPDNPGSGLKQRFPVNHSVSMYNIQTRLCYSGLKNSPSSLYSGRSGR